METYELFSLSLSSSNSSCIYFTRFKVYRAAQEDSMGWPVVIYWDFAQYTHSLYNLG